MCSRVGELIMPRQADTPPVPAYGLAGAFHGERWVEGEGHDLCTVVHRPEGSQANIIVGVDRRDAGRDSRPDSSEDADADVLAVRMGMATALVVDLPGLGSSVFSVAADLAEDRAAWRTCEMVVDGKRVAGVEGQHGEGWIAYCLVPGLIIYVIAPTDERPDPIEVGRL